MIAEQLELFNPSRWPRKPYCSDDLEQGVRIRSLASALKKPYIQANPPNLRVWSIYDVDRPGAAVAWEDAGLPPPSWAATNKANGHAHLVWGLTAPVLVDIEDARQGPLRYLVAVEGAFRAKLEADQGFAGLITKNPAHPLWRTLRGPRMSYELGELAEWVDLTKHKPKSWAKPGEIGLGRNCTVFEWLRQWGYRNIRHYKQEVRNFVLWQAETYEKAMQRNADFRTPMDSREVHHIAKSVAKWTWNRFDLADSDRRFSERQRARGAKGASLGGLARSVQFEDKRTSAALLKAHGLNKTEIAEELGVARMTVVRWLREPAGPLAGVASPAGSAQSAAAACPKDSLPIAPNPTPAGLISDYGALLHPRGE